MNSGGCTWSGASMDWTVSGTAYWHWDLGTLKVRSTPWTLYHCNSTAIIAVTMRGSYPACNNVWVGQRTSTWIQGPKICSEMINSVVSNVVDNMCNTSRELGLLPIRCAWKTSREEGRHPGSLLIRCMNHLSWLLLLLGLFASLWFSPIADLPRSQWNLLMNAGFYKIHNCMKLSHKMWGEEQAVLSKSWFIPYHHRLILQFDLSYLSNFCLDRRATKHAT